MLFDTVLKKTSSLFAAILVMTSAWSMMHLPGANLQMVTFALLGSSALCSVYDFKERIKLCTLITLEAAAAQFCLGITADLLLVRIIVSTSCAFLILLYTPDRQLAVIALLTTYLALFAPSGFSDSLNRSIDLVFSGAVILFISQIGNMFLSDSSKSGPRQPYSLRESAIITAELAIGFIIYTISKHEQFAWIIMSILFIHMAETPNKSLSELAIQRITATLFGILAGGIYLATFCSINYRMIYIVPITGTLSFFLLYLKNNYFIFTFLFMFTITIFSDWMLGAASRFNFTEVMFTRSTATLIGGVLLLCGKNLMQKESVS